jgi:hypothetical protein
MVTGHRRVAAASARGANGAAGADAPPRPGASDPRMPLTAPSTPTSVVSCTRSRGLAEDGTVTDEDFTQEKLLEFLREAPTQGVLNPAVARSRANAIEHLFPVLTREERADVRLIDVDRLVGRLHKIEGSTLRPEVVDLYRTRVHEALVDYLAWLANPKTFATISGHTLRRDFRAFTPASENAEEMHALEAIALATSERRKDFISVPLRDGVTVYITNLPLDLSAAEADKITRVVAAMALPGKRGAPDAD